MADVFHRFYTHAPQGPSDTTGARIVPITDHDAESLLPEDLVGELDALLKKITRVANRVGYVICRYRSGADAYACVVVLYPDFVKDFEGRDGVLTHARVVKTEASEAWLDVTALVEAAQSFPIRDLYALPEGARFAEYVKLLGADQDVILKPVGTDDLEQLSPQLFTDFLTASLGMLGNHQQKQVRVRSSEESLIAQLALASCAVPIGLQPFSTWALDVGEGCPVDTVFSPSDGMLPSAAAGDRLVKCVARYVNFLTEAPDELISILRDPGVRNVAEFGNKVDRASVKAPFTAAVGREEMARNKGKQTESVQPRVRDDLDTFDQNVAAEINRQMGAVEDELRLYIDQRFADMESRLTPIVRQPHSSDGEPAKDPKLRARVALGTFVAIVIAVVVWWRYPPAKNAQGVKETAGTTGTRPETTSTAPSTASADTSKETDQQILAAVIKATGPNDWAEAFKTLIDTHPEVVTRFLTRVAAESDLSASDAAELKKYAAQIEKKATRESMVAADRRALREILRSHIARKYEQSGVLDDDQYYKMQQLFDFWRSLPGEVNDDPRFDVEGEIIFRWMEWQQP